MSHDFWYNYWGQVSQGWTDSQMIISLMLLNLAGGESVSDLDLLEKDEGLCKMLGEFETCGMRRRERRALEKRWRVERRRRVPSESAVFRYLERFHDVDEESKREAHRAFIAAPNKALEGLGKVNTDVVGFVQSRSPHTEATLDMDATLVETRKQEALYSYKKHRAYQPLITYWSEAELIVHSEFRDGNVPAGHQQLRVLIEALDRLPAGVEKVMLRSDTAGYQRELLRYCAEGRDDRFGVIEFAVGVDVTAEFRRAVSEVAEQDWQTLYRRVGEHRVDTGQQWAEVNFVPNWIGHSKTSPEYRFIATRERLIEQPLPAMEGQMELPFPAMELSNRGWYKVFGVVTNRSIAADELIWWSRQRCGKGEEVHSVLKSDLAGGRLPSGLFGANAAWWAISVLAFNLNSAMKRLVLGGQVGGQASEGGAPRPDRPTGPCDASRQEVDHPSGPWTSLIRVAAQGAVEDIGAGCRAASSIATLPSCQAGPCLLRPENSHNWQRTAADTLKDGARDPVRCPIMACVTLGRHPDTPLKAHKQLPTMSGGESGLPPFVDTGKGRNYTKAESFLANLSSNVLIMKLASLNKRTLAWRGLGYLREAGIVLGAYFIYMFVRKALIADIETVAFENATKLISFQLQLGFFWEPGWQQWAIDTLKGIVVFFNWAYILTFAPIILATAFFAYTVDRVRYHYYRNVILLSFAVALVVFAVFPLAPPRFLPEYGFIDTIRHFGPTGYASREFSAFYNAFAAMPSLHFSWTLLLGIYFLRSKIAWLKVWGILYPTMTFFAITITGNHYIMDAVGGLAVAVISVMAYESLVRVWHLVAPYASAGKLAASRAVADRRRRVNVRSLPERMKTQLAQSRVFKGKRRTLYTR